MKKILLIAMGALLIIGVGYTSYTSYQTQRKVNSLADDIFNVSNQVRDVCNQVDGSNGPNIAC